MGELDVPEIVTKSSRDPEALRVALARWLAGVLPEGADPEVGPLEGTSATGMSSETLLVEAAWTEGGTRTSERLVVRLAPDAADVPVFPAYDLGAQFEVIRLVGERSDVPVPPTRWYEPSSDALGAPFFVMGRIDGRVPPDVLPYDFGDSWLFDAAPDDQRRLQDGVVSVLARLHAVEVDDSLRFLDFTEPGPTALRRRLRRTGDWFEWVASSMPRSPLVADALAWLEERVPDDDAALLSWGDSRIGNVLFDGFDPAAVLDWEMAGLGPRELDLSWLAYAHVVFEDLVEDLGMGEGMPGFLRLDDVAGTYEALTGHGPRHLDWYTTYAAVQYAIVFLRTGFRQVHFGERAMPDDVDELVMNARRLRSYIVR